MSDIEGIGERWFMDGVEGYDDDDDDDDDGTCHYYCTSIDFSRIVDCARRIERRNTQVATFVPGVILRTCWPASLDSSSVSDCFLPFVSTELSLWLAICS